MKTCKTINIFFVLFSIICVSGVPAQNSEKQIHYYSVNNIDSLKRSLILAVPGDQIAIKSGEYILTGSLKINGKNRIKITGNGSVHLIVSNSSSRCISIINSSDITIKNINLSSPIPKTGTSTTEGIYLEKADNILIDNCSITGFSAGIYSVLSRGVTIKASSFLRNTQWAVYGNYENLAFIENNFENNGGLFFINGRRFHSVGITLNTIYMEDNWADNNGSGGNNFIPIPFKNRDKSAILSPLNQELNKDKTYEEGITGSSIQEELNRELELENTGRIDRHLENSDLYSSPFKY